MNPDMLRYGAGKEHRLTILEVTENLQSKIVDR